MSVNNDLQSASIKHSHYLYRYQTYEVNRAFSIINKAQQEINEALLKRADITNWTTKRQEDLLTEINGIQNEYQNQLNKMLDTDMKDLTVQEQKYNLNLLATTLKPYKEIIVSDRIIPPNVIYGMAKKSYIMLDDGTTLTPRQFIKKITDADSGQVLQSIRQGMLTGRNGSEIKRNLVNTFRMERNHADSMVRTLTNHFSSEARSITGKENPDIIKGYKWLSTLDFRTSSRCRFLDAKNYFYDNPEKSTLPGEIYPPQHYNCYHKDTEVMTNNGWKFFYDLDENDRCLSVNPDNIKEHDYIKPIKHIKQKHNGNLIKFYNKTFDMVVTPDHNMMVKYSKKDGSGKYRFVQAKDMPKWNNSIYRGLEWMGNNPENIQLGDYLIPTELYCKFMGYYLSEGSTTQIKSRHREGYINSYRVAIAQEKYHDEMFNALKELPFKVTSTGRAKINIYDRSVGKDLKKYGKSFQKYVPEIIKTLDKDMIEIFLDAYILGDGSVMKGKKWKGHQFKDHKHIHTSSDKMASDLGELILKVGGRPSYRYNETKGKAITFSNGTYITNHNMWDIHWCLRTSTYVDRIKREYIPYNDYVYCVELPKWHTLLVRYNGKVAWSGNCRSTTTYITRSWKEMGINIEEAPEGTRSSLNGYVPSKTTYYEWLEGQSATIQKDVLGVKRYDMWKAGDVKPYQFYSQDGRWLTLKELDAKGI